MSLLQSLKRGARQLGLLLPIAWMGCGDDNLIQPPAEIPLEESFAQIKASSIDILFVIDNSGSMASNQTALSQNFDRFFNYLDPDPTKRGESGEVDYRLAVATTDVKQEAGKFRCGPKASSTCSAENPAVLLGGEGYDPLDLFRKRVIVGTDGTAREEGLRAAELALNASRSIKDRSGNPAFLRDHAFLYVIFVTDEDDDSFGEVRYYQRMLLNIKGIGNEETVKYSAIAGPVPDGCKGEKDTDPSAAAGHRYYALSSVTGGVIGDICNEDWGATLEELAVQGLGLRKRFQLKEAVRDLDASGSIGLEDFLHLRVRYPCSVNEDSHLLSEAACGEVIRNCGGDAHEPSVLCVPVWDEEKKEGVWFDESDASLFFGGAAIPGPGSTLEVSYFPRDKRL